MVELSTRGIFHEPNMIPKIQKSRENFFRKSQMDVPGACADTQYLNSTQKWYIFYTMFMFEFDDRKSRANLSKHGINFIDAQLLWNDPNLLEIPAKTEDEARYLVIGKIDGKLWSAVITYRGTNIRLISVRRSRNEEAILYEG